LYRPRMLGHRFASAWARRVARTRSCFGTAGKSVSDGTDRRELAATARSEIGLAFRLAAESAGLARLGVTPYLGRHTFASLLVQDGVPLQVVTELLGHTSTQEVESTYGHLAPHPKEDAVRSLGPER
jgi:integrase